MSKLSDYARDFLRHGLGNNTAGKQVGDVIDELSAARSVTPDDSDGTGNTILKGERRVAVGAVTNDSNDFIVLPPIADVPDGHEIHILCNAGTNFELHTPASSETAINNVNSDGTQEYLCTDTDTVRVWKLSDADGWVAQSITNLGAVRTAVEPD